MADKAMTLEEKYNDYEKTPVPASARKTWFEQGMVWLGEGFGLSGLATGGILAQGLSFKEMCLVSVAGAFLVFLMAALSASVSTHTHMPVSFTCRRSFGVRGAKLIGVIFCFSNFGWYAFQADLFGNTISSVIKEMSGKSMEPVIFTVIGGLAMSMTAIFGFKAIKRLSEIGIPLLFVLCIIAVIKTGSIVPFDQIIQSGPTDSPISIPAGISIVVGSFAVGIAMMGLQPFLQNAKGLCGRCQPGILFRVCTGIDVRGVFYLCIPELECSGDHGPYSWTGDFWSCGPGDRTVDNQ